VVRSNNASIKQIDRASSADDKLSFKLDAVNDSIFKLETKILEVKTNSTASSELGPLKYLSGLTGYPMDKIINWFLLIIIFVFDPLAIALVIAANFAFKQKDEPEIEYPLEEKVEDMRNVVSAYDDLQDEIKEWEEASLTDLQETSMPEETPEEDWQIKDEEQEPYEVYTGPQEPELTPMEKDIQGIQGDRHLSDWGKRSKIEEIKNKYRKAAEGKTYW
jgi:hypothetical protein